MLATGVDQRVLRWFGHVESTDDPKMAKSVMRSTVSEERLCGMSKY